MTGFAIRGWCPDAWRPMVAGDGLLVRVKPRLGRLTRAQLAALGEAAAAYGNGLIDLTSRANLQLRGVSEAGWPALLERLIALDLVDADPEAEKRRTLLVAPEWLPGDDTHRIATDMLARLGDLPALPGKMGFVIDAGPAPLLADAPGDFRIERGRAGEVLLRADGRARGAPVEHGREAEALVALAQWFVASGGVAVGRMRRHAEALPAFAAGDRVPAAAAPSMRPGGHPLGGVVGLAFGQIDAGAIARLLDHPFSAVRVTPWRSLLVEDVLPTDPALIADPASPLLRTDACVGAPACPQGQVETRDLARRLAPWVSGRLHVSGCAKGCARALPSEVTVTGRDRRYDLAFDARADAPALHAGLSADALLSLFGSTDAA
ncbi:cobalamin biosynthesis protein CobG [uncultured Sphingomonas sp.]|uniref:cobalamin biosynthesis protein CobG n=1 Tax=uncultured Sphingomonas sp. TaxID=158754 RepID=UPI0025F72977|nr:cobalamin biosynthesis protein CobG [uncultured Sphingomonas sp.]